MLSPPPSTPEQDLEAEALAHDLAADLPSPYCPGRSIASCPSSAARDLEDDILDLALQGKDRKEIEAVLVARFGEEKMGNSQQSELIVGIILAALLALALIVIAARKWMRRPAERARDRNRGPLDGASASEIDRLEDELDELDEL